jgi:hypothetical protein
MIAYDRNLGYRESTFFCVRIRRSGRPGALGQSRDKLDAMNADTRPPPGNEGRRGDAAGLDG